MEQQVVNADQEQNQNEYQRRGEKSGGDGSQAEWDRQGELMI